MNGCNSPKGLENFEQQLNNPPSWTSTTMVYSVKRFGEVLQNLKASFPNDERIGCAFKIFSDLTTGEFDITHTAPQVGLMAYPELSTVDYYNSRGYRLQLDKEQWEQAMDTFNRLKPLTLEKKALFGQFMVPILQAGIVGLLHVFLYEHYRAWAVKARKLSVFPEIWGHKYIYLTPCEPVKDD
jgi:hypothetical protein